MARGGSASAHGQNGHGEEPVINRRREKMPSIAISSGGLSQVAANVSR